MASNLSAKILNERVAACARCPRLIEHCREVARTKRRAYLDWEYWGKPVSGFGDLNARLWIIGLAPGAHGANRTGRVFTGDESGNFLYAALHRAGFANQPTSVSREDGLKLTDCYISIAGRCAPPGNKPTTEELVNCSPFLIDEWSLLKRKRVILALGKIAWDAVIRLARQQGCEFAVPAFGHGACFELSPNLKLLGSYHVSQQNTFTGRLTQVMFDSVLKTARAEFT